MTPRDLFLPRLVAHLRTGGVHEISGPSTGRTSWSTTRLRLGPEDEGRGRLQFQITIRMKSGLTATSPWARCDWTIEDLLELRDEADEKDVVSTGMDETIPGEDPVVDAVTRIMSGGRIELGGFEYVLDDGTISVMTNGRLERPDRDRHPADDWIGRD